LREKNSNLSVNKWQRWAGFSRARAIVVTNRNGRVMADSASYRGVDQGSSTVVAKKDVNLADSLRFNGQDPVSGRGAFEAQCAQAISAAYYFDLAP